MEVEAGIDVWGWLIIYLGMGEIGRNRLREGILKGGMKFKVGCSLVVYEDGRRNELMNTMVLTAISCACDEWGPLVPLAESGDDDCWWLPVGVGKAGGGFVVFFSERSLGML